MYKHFKIHGKTIRFEEGDNKCTSVRRSSISHVEFEYMESSRREFISAKLDVDSHGELVRWLSEKEKVVNTLELEYSVSMEQVNSWTVERPVYYMLDSSKSKAVPSKYNKVSYTDDFETWNEISKCKDRRVTFDGVFLVTFKTETGVCVGSQSIKIHRTQVDEVECSKAVEDLKQEIYNDIDLLFDSYGGVDGVNDNCYIKDDIIVAEPLNTNIRKDMAIMDIINVC